MRFVILLLPLLAACADYVPAPKKLTVEQTQQRYEFPVNTALHSLSVQEREALDAFFAAIPSGRVQTVTLETENPVMLESVKAEQIITLAGEHGIARSAIRKVLPETAMTAPMAVTASYSHLVLPSPCPDWRHSPIFNHDNGRMGNYGCATVTNLGRQIADPNDLVAPEPSDAHATTITSTRAIERLNSGEFIRPKNAASTR